jgi:hypothetical protein
VNRFEHDDESVQRPLAPPIRAGDIAAETTRAADRQLELPL